MNALLELSKQLWKKYIDRFIGKDMEVLIEKVDGNARAYGHTNNYIDVKIDNINAKPGQKVVIKLQKSMIQSK